LKAVFEGEGRIQRLQYRRGEPLVVERLVAKAPVDTMLTPFQVARQHGRVAPIEYQANFPRVHLVYQAFHLCAEMRMPARLILCRDRLRLTRWIFGEQPFSLETSFRLPVIEDADIPKGKFGVCGSSIGDMLADIEYCVICGVNS
jgi:hypothetical protein